MSDKVVAVALTVACAAVVVVAGIYASEHINCFNFFGLVKGCAVHQ